MVFLNTMAWFLWQVFLIYIVGISTLAAAVAAYQESKIWAPSNLPSLTLWGAVKVFLFNIVWFATSVIGCLLVCAKFVLTLGKSDVAADTHIFTENAAAWLVSQLFVGRVTVNGEENLPDPASIPAPVFVANHASQIDVAAVYSLERRFKWIAKKSVLYLPGVGAVMFLGGHVLIDRVKGKNKNSVATLFDKSNAAVASGIPMFFFPQGTRYMAERKSFKDGAFIVAQTNKSCLIPVSIEIPLNIWNHGLPLVWKNLPQVVLTVHKPIPVNGTEDIQILKGQCSDQIYSVLPKIWTDENDVKKKKE